MSAVFILFRETSDQLGTSEAVGAYSTRERAEAVGSVMDSRTYAKEFTLNKVPLCVELRAALDASPHNWRKHLNGEIAARGGEIRETGPYQATISVLPAYAEEVKALVYQIVPIGFKFAVEPTAPPPPPQS